MKVFKKVSLTLAALGLGASIAGAQCCYQKRSIITFSQPVEVPGRVLLPGTYTFMLQDSQTTRHIVQIWDANRTHLLDTIEAAPAWRNKVSFNTVINFEERGGNSPEAIRTWFYPGDSYGQTFVYPKAETQVAAIAAPVETEAVAETAAVETPVEPPPVAAPEEPAPVEAAPVAEAQPEAAPAAEVAAATTPDAAPATELPKTASDSPLFALFGLISLAGAGLVRLKS